MLLGLGLIFEGAKGVSKTDIPININLFFICNSVCALVPPSFQQTNTMTKPHIYYIRAKLNFVKMHKDADKQQIQKNWDEEFKQQR